MLTKFVRNVFIDSEVNAVGNGEITKIYFPPSAFAVSPKEIMKITLTTAEIRRNWYNINQHNNTFYWFDPTGAGSYTEIVVSAGNYDNFTDLGNAIQAAIVLVAPLVGTTVSYDAITRKFEIDLTGAAGPLNAGSRFVSFQVKSTPPAPAGVSPNGYYNDFHEIIGGFPTRDNWTAPVDLMSGSTAGGAVVANQFTPFVAQLNTIEAVYIRTSLHSGNYQTYGFEKDLPNQQGLTPSQIFARIPLKQQHYTDLNPFISFEDPNSLFSLYLTQTQLSQVYFSLTDDKSRLLPEVASGQATVGNISFKLSLRWEVLQDELPPDERRLLLKNVANTPDNLGMP